LSQFVVRVIDRALLRSVGGTVYVSDRRIVARGVSIHAGQRAKVGGRLTVLFVAFLEAGRLSRLCARAVTPLPLLLGVLGVVSERVEELRFLVIRGRIWRHHIGSHDHVASDAGCGHTYHY
jgi:hypothetical protein